jgi:hypothetical protein
VKIHIITPGRDIMEKDLEKIYQDKIRRLEEDISGLRMSRRIMMTLLEQAQINQKAEQERLLGENRRLNRQVALYAKQLWQMKTRVSVRED